MLRPTQPASGERTGEGGAVRRGWLSTVRGEPGPRGPEVSVREPVVSGGERGRPGGGGRAGHARPRGTHGRRRLQKPGRAPPLSSRHAHSRRARRGQEKERSRGAQEGSWRVPCGSPAQRSRAQLDQRPKPKRKLINLMMHEFQNVCTTRKRPDPRGQRQAVDGARTFTVKATGRPLGHRQRGKGRGRSRNRGHRCRRKRRDRHSPP